MALGFLSSRPCGLPPFPVVSKAQLGEVLSLTVAPVLLYLGQSNSKNLKEGTGLGLEVLTQVMIQAFQTNPARCL